MATVNPVDETSVLSANGVGLSWPGMIALPWVEEIRGERLEAVRRNFKPHHRYQLMKF